MSIIRTVKRDNPFVQIDKNCLEDKNLSWKAKGLLAYLLSRPDNWKVIIEDLRNKSTDGRDSIYSGLKELTEAKYIIKKRMHDEKGKFTGWEYQVFEQPQLDEISNEDSVLTVSGKSEYGKTVYGKTVYGKSATNNNNINNINLNNKELINNANDDNAKISKISNFYQENFGVINPFIHSELVYWTSIMNYELVEEAMKRALRQQKRWNYVIGILKDWKNRKVQTLADVEAIDVEFKKQSNATKTGKVKSKRLNDNHNENESLLEKLLSEHQEAEKQKDKMSLDELQKRRNKVLEKLRSS